MKVLTPKNREHFFGFSTVLLFSFPVLPFALRSIAMGLWALSSIFYISSHTQKLKFSKRNFLQLSVITLPFIILIISLVYTENQKRGVDLVVRILPLALCPILFFLCKNLLTRKLFELCKTVFVFSTFAIVAYSFISSYNQREHLDRPFSKIEYQYNGVTPETITKEKAAEIKYRRFKVYIEEISGTHSTYLGIFILLSLFFIGEKVFDRKQNKWIKISGLLLGASMFIWLAYISVRAPILAFLVSVLFVLLVQIRKPKVILGTVVLISLALFIFYNAIPTLKLRIDEVVENKFAIPQSGKDPLLFNSTNVRLGSLYCSTEVFKSSPITGVGIGDVQDSLNDCYTQKIGAVIYSWDTYNNHNQYLFFATAAGVLGILSFLMMMFYLIFISIKRNDSLAIFFFTSSSILFLTENVLVRSDGIMYFAIIGYFIFFFKNDKK